MFSLHVAAGKRTINLRDDDDATETIAWLSCWYAALYVVIEGWQKLGLHDDEVDRLLASDNVESLRLFRHWVYHFHPDYWNEKLTTGLMASPDSPKWARELSSQFGRYFMEQFTP